MKRILVCEDEDVIRDFVVINLKRAGYDVTDVNCGEEALKTFDAEHGNFDIVLLDIMMPGIDGFTVCKKLRERSSTLGIIMLTAKAQEMDKVSGLMIGADDYITKPFGTSELLARIRTSLRHASQSKTVGEGDTPQYRAGELVIDYDKHVVTLQGNILHFTQIEYKILTFLAQNAGCVVTYDALLSHVWGPYTDSNNRILRVNMANIRRKLETNPADPQYIFTEIGVGYRMVESE